MRTRNRPPKGSSRRKLGGGVGVGGSAGGGAGAGPGGPGGGVGGVGATAAAGSSDGSATPHLPSLAEQLSYMHLPRPFKNPGYNKNVNRRAKNMKAIISQERERERAERERRRVLGKSGGGGEGGDAEAMDVEPTDGVSLDALAEEVPTCNVDPFPVPQLTLTRTLDTSIEAPPSIWPPKHYCDITGLEVRPRPFSSSSLRPTHARRQAPYTDPSTGLRFHDKSIYDVVKGLVSHFLAPSPLAHTPQSTSTAKDYLSARGVSTVVK